MEPTRTAATNETVERVKAGAHEAVEKAADMTLRAADTINEKSGQVRDAQERLQEQIREYVRENPVTSLGIAVGSGFILSRLMGHR
ncbi:DUF883 family protein [Methylomicrobium sp. RS1]|jgi:ElaB/YqjD/DUF883 family membrane-anchored ribosome-binding protein|uniref:DUF883 family protein n=1 Tax=Candidatus Methylomicrobium oryzae TaxID=2802053 RepID=UPI001920BF22|nr:DUF883 family protein [Methylomicrobium sp. RS1]MBL1263572.1 DUF883 family protein [Methylomicrobium sp. RS1]